MRGKPPFEMRPARALSFNRILQPVLDPAICLLLHHEEHLLEDFGGVAFNIQVEGDSTVEEGPTRAE